jgi:glycosyltransferase involved in cell wall biosynthesis
VIPGEHRICIATQSHLSRNPRVLKEALALAAAGYRVHILTAIYSDKLLNEDLRLIKDHNIGYEFYSDLRVNNFASFSSRLIKKLSVSIKTKLGIESVFNLGYAPFMFKNKLEAIDADLNIMHQEMPTVIGSELTDDHKIAFDMEDWYSEDLLPNAQRIRPLKLLKKAEALALKNGVYCTTTSQALANELKTAYKSEHMPFVIFNSFDNSNFKLQEANHSDKIMLYWISQTIGEGRGLEFFISCMGKSNVAWQLNLRGHASKDYIDHLKKMVNAKDTLVILPMLKNEDILQDMSNYDVGLALESDSPPNRDLSISNKFFHYMAAGLPIIASEIKGHAEIGRKHTDIIFMYKQHHEDDLVAILNKTGADILKKGKNFLRDKVLKIYNENYAWKNEAKKLINLVKNALENAG